MNVQVRIVSIHFKNTPQGSYIEVLIDPNDPNFGGVRLPRSGFLATAMPGDMVEFGKVWTLQPREDPGLAAQGVGE